MLYPDVSTLFCFCFSSHDFLPSTVSFVFAMFDVNKVAAIALAEACSMTPSNMTPTLVDLLSRHYSPAGLVELVVTVSVAHMFHRWTSYYVPET